MEVDSDNTAVMRVQRDFAAFLSQPTLNSSTTRKKSPTFMAGTRLSFDGSIMDPEPTENIRTRRPSSTSLKAILEREKEERLKKAEMISAKGQVSKLQGQITNLQSSNKRSRIEYEKDIIGLKNDHHRELSKHDDLKLQLKFMTEKEEQARETIAELQRSMDKNSHEASTKYNRLLQEKLKLQSQHLEFDENAKAKIFSLKREAMRQEMEMNSCHSQLDESNEKLSIQIKKVAELNKQMDAFEKLKAQSDADQIRMKALQGTLSQQESDATYNKAMKSDIARLPQLETENRKLRDENKYLNDIQENTLLLNERLEGAQRRAERLEDRCATIPQLQLQNEELKGQLDRWQSLNTGGNVHRPKSPTEVSRRLHELQTNESVLLEQKGHLQTTRHSLEESLKVSQHECSELRGQLSQEHTKLQQSADLIKRLQRKLLLITKERDGYKDIIDQYENEVTVNLKQAGSNISESRIQQLEQLQQRSAKQLELTEKDLDMAQGQVTAYKQRCSELEGRLDSLNRSHGIEALSQPVDERDQKTVLALRKRIEELEKELEKISEEKYVLEGKIEQRNLQGDYDPRTTKVLHFSMNPASLAQKQRAEGLEKLRIENEELKQRIKLLEESGGQVEDLTVKLGSKMSEPSTSNTKQVEELKSAVATAEKKVQRLKEVFQKTSLEWREQVYLLTGYKIDLVSNNQYKLMSMYSESPEDYIIFQGNDAGETQLLETAYSARLTDFIECYLEKQHSIPGFLSSVTIDLLSKQTMMQ